MPGHGRQVGTVICDEFAGKGLEAQLARGNTGGWTLWPAVLAERVFVFGLLQRGVKLLARHVELDTAHRREVGPCKAVVQELAGGDGIKRPLMVLA